MSTRDHSVLVGMGEVLLSLAMKHCNSHQWASWLKILLQGAATEGDATMVAALLKAGASSSGGRVKDGVTPLHAAARGGSLGVVALILETMAMRDVNKKTQATGETPLHLAVKFGHADVALALVRAGGDVNLADAKGNSPLIRAVGDGRVGLVNDLLLRGSRVNTKCESGDTALGFAVRKGRLDVIKVLLRAGACPGSRGKNNRSPVDWAVYYGDTNALKDLLAVTPNLDTLGDGGKSALRIAVQKGHPKAIDVLADAGANLCFRTAEGHMPLHLACLHLQPGSVEALLRRNANEKLRNKDNELPHDIVGHCIPAEERDDGVVGDIRKMLARAPADRVWRRRGWLAMLNARKRGADKEHRRKDHEDEAEGNQHDEAETPSVLSSRRKLADGGRWATDDAAHVHPSLKRFHSTVTKMVSVADELIFRTIVSYL
ncbi:unnamed protein product [Laminaria digitata]